MRLRHHVNPLKGGYGLSPVSPVPLPAIGPVEVELGCADARFLFERARAEPRLTCIGVDIREETVREVNLRAQAEGLPGLFAVFANVTTDLPGLFPDGRLDRIYLNFPDPWFKRRQRKRRVLTPEVAATLSRQLAPDGEVFFQSDVYDLALEAMAALEAHGGFENAAGPWSFLPQNPYGARSLREVRCEEKGAKVWRLRYRSASQRSGSETS